MYEPGRMCPCGKKRKGAMTTSNDLPWVSLVTPSFNQAAFLEETIQSVLRQDYPNIEYLVVDGGSTDGSVDILRRYADRLAWWVSEPDNGQTHAIIKGFARARGKYLGWLCSDDVLEPSMVSISVDYHRRHPEVACTHGDRIRIDAKGNIYSLLRYPEFRPWFLRYGMTLPQETTLFTREAYDAVGGLDESLHMAMDFDLWCKFSARYAIRHIPAVLGRFRAHATNKSTQFTHQAESADSGPYFEEYRRLFPRHFGRAYRPARHAAAKRWHTLLALLDRRSRRYRRELAAVSRVRLEERDATWQER